MAFTRYPLPPAAPLTVAANATGAAMAFTEHVANIGGVNRMFLAVVRLASGGGPAAGAQPTVILTASGGTPVNVPFQDAFVSVRNAANQIVASVKMDPTPDAPLTFVQGANGVYLVEVVVINPGTVSWEIAIRNEDLVNAHDFTWVVADGEGEAQQPWIDVTTANVSMETLINRDVTGTLVVTNKGTGELVLTGTTPAVGPDFSLPAFPAAAILPNGSQNLLVSFSAPATPPAPDGSTSVTAVLDSADADAGVGLGHNRQFTLSALTRALEVALLLDESGSMAWEPDGDRIPPGSPPSRWDELAAAANQFLDLLAAFGNGRGTFGVARFRATDPTNPSTHDIVAPGPITNTMGPAQTAISAITPVGWTHMGDGINRLLTPGANYFSTDATAELVNQRCILLMSDGASNQGINPRDFIPPTGTDLIDRHIAIFSAGYGIPGEDDVDHVLLDDMRAGSFDGGLGFRAVNVEALSAMDLANAFRSAIKSGLTPVTSPSDPRGELGNGVTEQRHQVVITPYDTRAVFILNWNTPDQGRLRLELLTPACDLITPGTEESGVTFRSGDRYQMFVIEQEYLENRVGDQGRYGLWTLVVSSEGLYYFDENEVYEYDVIVDSRLQLDVATEKLRHTTGQPINLLATLTLDGAPLPNASVELQAETPGRSVINWLALTPVTAAEFNRAADALAQDTDINPLTIKAFALKQKGKTFNRISQQDTITMRYADGAYHASITETSAPETYTFYVTATGVTDDGVLYRREKRLQVYVNVKADPDFTLLDITYTLLTDDDTRMNQADILARPRDRFGNVVLIDPNLNPTIQLDASGGQFTGPIVSNLDGSYSRILQYPPDVRPVIRLNIGGEPIVQTDPVVPVDHLTYVDTVINFEPGSEGSAGANAHADPEAALGNVQTKDTFVSLGGYGVLSVGLQDVHAVVVARGNDDITVFVQRDDDLRRYLVEVLPAENDNTWVALGESSGVTQSFSLAASGLKQVRAVRITDLSGRVFDADVQPLSTPGVSIRGVGFRAVGTLQQQPDIIVRAAGNVRLDAEGPQANTLGTITVVSLDKERGRVLLTFDGYDPQRRDRYLVQALAVYEHDDEGSVHVVEFVRFVSNGLELHMHQLPSARPMLAPRCMIEVSEIMIEFENEVTPVDVRVASGEDDAEENEAGEVKLNSPDLELGQYDDKAQTVGIRFRAAGIPQGAKIVRAYVQFTAEENSPEKKAALVIQGEAVDNAALFTTAKRNITSRTRTRAQVEWHPKPWKKGDTGSEQQTTDISSVIQEIVDRPNWVGDNALVLIISGTGNRDAVAYDRAKKSDKAPLLHVEYKMP